ncbi:hypothetical protein ACNS7O_08855 [Haloferacaceae archaeon DSL9]
MLSLGGVGLLAGCSTSLAGSRSANLQRTLDILLPAFDPPPDATDVVDLDPAFHESALARAKKRLDDAATLHTVAEPTTVAETSLKRAREQFARATADGTDPWEAHRLARVAAQEAVVAGTATLARTGEVTRDALVASARTRAAVATAVGSALTYGYGDPFECAFAFRLVESWVVRTRRDCLEIVANPPATATEIAVAAGTIERSVCDLTDSTYLRQSLPNDDHHRERLTEWQTEATRALDQSLAAREGAFAESSWAGRTWAAARDAAETSEAAAADGFHVHALLAAVRGRSLLSATTTLGEMRSPDSALDPGSTADALEEAKRAAVDTLLERPAPGPGERYLLVQILDDVRTADSIVAASKREEGEEALDDAYALYRRAESRAASAPTVAGVFS